jgi:catechol 2,3-dioxygenase-like lactoylglutathione lyase family enzyme
VLPIAGEAEPSIYNARTAALSEECIVLLKGLNHVATITNDASRLIAFYQEVFEAEVLKDGSEFPEGKGPRLSIIKIGDWSELNVFQIEGNTEADRQTPMFGRGRIDHLAVQAASIEAFETIRERLMARGAADDFVTDFGAMLSIFFRDPDGLECEVCVENPDLIPGVQNPPGTRAARYS